MRLATILNMILIGTSLLNSEYKKKVNLEEAPEDDTIEFNAVDTFFFDPEKSLPLTGENLK